MFRRCCVATTRLSSGRSVRRNWREVSRSRKRTRRKAHRPCRKCSASKLSCVYSFIAQRNAAVFVLTFRFNWDCIFCKLVSRKLVPVWLGLINLMIGVLRQEPVWRRDGVISTWSKTVALHRQLLCCKFSVGTALNVQFTPNGMCAKNNTRVYAVRTSNNRMISSGDLYWWLLPQCEALPTCRSGFPIAVARPSRRGNLNQIKTQT